MKRREFFSRMRNAALLATTSSVLGASDLRGQPGRSVSRIRIGQIGVKHAHAAGKLSAVRNLSYLFEVVGVAEPDPAARARVEKTAAYAGVPWMSVEELLAIPGLQAVAVETEVSDLLATAARVIAAGKHLHLDKPAGESFPRFKQLLSEAERQRLIVQMGYMFRYNPAFQLCYQAVREGWLGDIFSVDTVMGKVLDEPSRQEMVPYRGGAMFELGCHVLDSVVKILGKPLRITSHGHRSRPRPGGDDFLDNQLAVLNYPKATATVRSSFIEVEGAARRQFVVCGTEGTLDIRPLEPPKVRLALTTGRGSYLKGYQDIVLPKLPRYDGEFMDLAAVIRGERAFDWSYEHDLVVQETLLIASELPTS